MEHEEYEEQKIDLFVLLADLIQAGRRLWALGLVLVMLCAGALTAYRYLTHSPVYAATASFTVKVANPLYASISSYNSKTAEQMAKTFPYIVSSGVLQQRIRDHLGLQYLPSISVTASTGTSILTMTVRDADPQRAYEVLNAVMTFYPEVAEFVVGPTVLVLLDESGIPTQAANPFNPANALVTGAILGAGLWLGLCVLLALSRSTIHNEKELTKLVNVPCLGQIPSAGRLKNGARPMIHHRKTSPGFSEAIRLLRLRVEKAMEERSSRILLISSASPGEGKTTVSVNLAISLAQKGRRVLLIDCDLRNPSVSKAMGLPESKALEAYLQGKADLREALRPTTVEGLFIIAGSSGSQETSRSAQDRLHRLIQASRSLFDYVLLDTPPSALLSDAAELTDAADGALYVIWQDRSPRDQILDGLQNLSDGGIPILGCVLNGVQRSHAGGYGYGYGYGTYGTYGTYGDSKRSK